MIMMIMHVHLNLDVMVEGMACPVGHERNETYLKVPSGSNTDIQLQLKHVLVLKRLEWGCGSKDDCP